MSNTTLVTCDIETQITILKIENLNPWRSLLPDNKEWHWTAFAILAMFFLSSSYSEFFPDCFDTSGSMIPRLVPEILPLDAFCERVAVVAVAGIGNSRGWISNCIFTMKSWTVKKLFWDVFSGLICFVFLKNFSFHSPAFQIFCQKKHIFYRLCKKSNFSRQISTVLHQSKKELSKLDQKWVKARPIILKIFSTPNYSL